MNEIKIYNQDCLEYMKTLADKSVDLIVTDPPYDIHVGIQGGSCSQHMGRSDRFKNENVEEIKTFGEGYDIKEFGKEFVRIMKNINIYFWCNKLQIPDYFNYYVNELGCNFEILSWHKTNCMPTYANKYLTDTEYCLYFKKNALCHPSTYEDAKTFWVEPINQVDKAKYEHPTIKPLSMIEKVIKNSSNEGDLVFDPFLGSGTTGVASKHLKRNFIGTEIDPKYFEIAQHRLNEPEAEDEFFVME